MRMRSNSAGRTNIITRAAIAVPLVRPTSDALTGAGSTFRDGMSGSSASPAMREEGNCTGSVLSLGSRRSAIILMANGIFLRLTP